MLSWTNAAIIFYLEKQQDLWGTGSSSRWAHSCCHLQLLTKQVAQRQHNFSRPVDSLLVTGKLWDWLEMLSGSTLYLRTMATLQTHSCILFLQHFATFLHVMTTFLQTTPTFLYFSYPTLVLSVTLHCWAQNWI